MNSFLSNEIIKSATMKVEERIHCFGEIYDVAKAKVQDVVCAGPDEWAVIDRNFNGME